MKFEARELREINDNFSRDAHNRLLIDFVKERFSVEYFHLISHFPDQDANIYEFLVGDSIVKMEQDVNSEGIFQITEILTKEKFLTGKKWRVRSLLRAIEEFSENRFGIR